MKLLQLIRISLLQILPPRIFVFVFNSWSLFKNYSTKCCWNKHSKIYIVSFQNKIRFASGKSRCMNYLTGFDSREKYISKVYNLELIPVSDGDIVIDCGANMGDLYNYYLEKKIKIDYHGFEPSPTDFYCLERNVPKGNHYNIALWNRDMDLEFYIDIETANSSVIQPPNFSNRIIVPGKTLNTLFPNSQIKLLKIEAEGGEPEVLQGANNIFPNISYITVDVGPERGLQQAETKKEVLNYMLSSNFSVMKSNDGWRKSILFVNNALNDKRRI
jgi:FkbM family methyltransferase